ncbi:MAG TPA: OmpA family protein [Candidatus Kryptonia bacterium]
MPVQKTVAQEQHPAVPLPSSFNHVGPIRIFFDFNRSNVNKNVYCIFDLIQASLGKNAAGRIKIRVEGNADSIGPSWYNMILSQKRAERVIDSLSRRLAIPRDRFEIVANGSTKPVSPNSTSEGRSNNRRVEVSVF